MSTAIRQRPRTARELVLKAGRLPVLAAAMTFLALPSAAWAQGSDGAAPARNPMKMEGGDKADKGDDKGKSKVAVSDQGTVDLHVKDEDLSNVLELLSIQTQKNIIASKSVSGKVTATLYNVTFYQAMDAILHVNGFGYIENGNFIFVYTNDELKSIQAALKVRVTKTIKLNYISADDAKEFITPLLSKEGGEVKINAKPKDFSIPDKAPTGKNDYALADTVVVFDFEENVKAIEELIAQIDTRPQQVLVESTILQTSLNEANAFGVDFSIIGDVNFVDFLNTGGPLSAAQALIKGGTGAAGQGFSPPDSRANAVTSTVGGTSGPGGFKAGIVMGDVSVFVRMLDTVTDTVILSNPKIVTLNRQPARVLVGKRVGYLNTTQTETSTTQSVEFLDTGTQLYVRPFIASTGEIRMELKPQVSSAEIRTVTDSGGRAVTIPDEVTQEMVTNVNVRDGQTVVLGGLFTENSTFSRQQVPWVGDIPILGAAFRGHDDSTVRSEIIFLITPTIVTDTLVAGASERALADIDRIRSGQRQGLLPFSRERQTDKLNVEAEALARDGQFEQALCRLRWSLSLNPFQPEAYRLREKITGEREHWSDPSMLNSYLDHEVIRRVESVPGSPTELPHLKPHGSVNVPRDKVRPVKQSSGVETIVKPGDVQPIVLPSPISEVYNPATMTDTAPKANAPAYLDTPDPSAPGEAGVPVSPAATDPAQATGEPGAMNTTPATDPANATGTNTPAPTEPKADEPDGATPAAANPAGTNPAGTTPASDDPNAANATAANAVATTTVVTTAAVTQPTTAGVVQPVNPNSTMGNGDATGQGTNAAVSVPLSGDDVTPEPAPAPKAVVIVPKPAPAVAVTPAPKKPSAPLATSLSMSDKRAVDEVQGSLPSLRGQIEVFGLKNGGSIPVLGNGATGWDVLISEQLLQKPPANGYVGGPNATKVVTGTGPDGNFHTNYGWIFNPRNGKLWAVGFDASDRPLAKPGTATASKVVVPVSETDAPTAGVDTDGPSR